MRVLILGATGMLGHKLYQCLGERLDVWVTTRGEAIDLAKYGFFCPDRVIGGVQATDLLSIENAIRTVKPHAVVNCIGVIKQQPLGKDPIACITINAALPHHLAAICDPLGARLLHISTDCVFAGTRGGYTESDLTDAEDLYGRTKALGETSAPNALTLRTSIIGRELSGGGFGLVEWFLSQNGQPVNGYRNAFFSGFTTLELSRIIQNVLVDHPSLRGVYQVSSDPIDKYTLLQLIREAYGVATPISPNDEVRIDRTLDSTRFRLATGYRPPIWPDMIREMASDLAPYATWRNHK